MLARLSQCRYTLFRGIYLIGPCGNEMGINGDWDTIDPRRVPRFQNEKMGFNRANPTV